MRILIFHPMRFFIFQPMTFTQILDPCRTYKKGSVIILYIKTMAELHGFVRPLDIITEFDGSDKDVELRKKPKYVRKFAMVDRECCMSDPPIKNQTKEEWFDSYDITVTVVIPLRNTDYICISSSSSSSSSFFSSSSSFSSSSVRYGFIVYSHVHLSRHRSDESPDSNCMTI